MAEEQEQKRGWGLWIAVALFLVFVVYPASIQPIGWLIDTGRFPASSVPAWKAFHAPLFWAQDNVPVVNQAMKWYSDWFYKNVLGMPV